MAQQRRLRERLLEALWPWGRIRRLKSALRQALADNAALRLRLDSRERRGRYKASK